MKVIVSKGSGFCFGVKRAIKTAFDTAERHPEGVYTLGPIIHNPQVVEKLRDGGVEVTERGEGVDSGRVVIIRSHGVAPSVYEELKEKGLEVVDATCPFVKKAQEQATQLSSEGYQVLIIGEESHPEVQGLLGFSGGGAIVVGPGDNVQALPLLRKVGIICQTTQSFSALHQVVSEVLPRVGELRVFNTICDATRVRQEETMNVAGQVDMILVVGGKNSANTMRLLTMCEGRGVAAHHIETAAEIRNEWFDGVKTVGITAGASTPDWIISDVVRYVENRE